MPSAAGACILLIGMRGTGKTTVGQRLAERLGIPFVDLDDHVQRRLGGRSVSEIWAQMGEAAWRQAEAESFSELVDESIGANPRIIALGGGAPLVPVIRQALQSMARDLQALRIVWLKASTGTIEARLRTSDSDRPSLTGADVVDEVQAVLEQREPVYRSLATVVINVDDLHVDEVVAKILTELVRADQAAR